MMMDTATTDVTTTRIHAPMDLQRGCGSPSSTTSRGEPESEEAVSQWGNHEHVPVRHALGDLFAAASPSPSTNACTRIPCKDNYTLMQEEDALEGSDDELDGFGTSPVREYPEEYAKYRMPQSVFVARAGMKSPIAAKRKRVEGFEHEGDEVEQDTSTGVMENRRVYVDMGKPLVPAISKRKGSSDFLRKGQWTPTEERLARMLIEAFEEGYLPIYTGIRLRGYLAVQLQCDPMRVSKKLCAGTVDGKRIPKNYGQKKFRLRRKQLWDRDEAGRILGALERLTKELWAETGIPPPHYLSLSSTRNADEDGVLTSLLTPDGHAPSSPVKKLSPATKSKKQKNGVVFPIIYLNLSKKLKQGANLQDAPGSTGTFGGVHQPYSPDSPTSGISLVDSNVSASGEQVNVDGESLQAAYDLLNLHWMAPSSSKGARSTPSTPSNAPPPLPPVREDVKVIATPPGMIHILPAPSKPAILRQQSPRIAS